MAFTSPLDNVRVASPCPANWNEMNGNDRMRYCGQCQLNVYNLSGMTKPEAEHLIANAEGRLCVRYYKRADGSIITQNCPVGLAALKRRVSRTATAFLSAVIGFFGGLGIFAAFGDDNSPLDNGHVMGAIAVEQYTPPDVAVIQGTTMPIEEMGQPIMGKMVQPAQIKKSPKRSTR